MPLNFNANSPLDKAYAVTFDFRVRRSVQFREMRMPNHYTYTIFILNLSKFIFRLHRGRTHTTVVVFCPAEPVIKSGSCS